MNFEKTKYGFWKQTDPEPFQYNDEYKSHQSTNNVMSALRIGWLSAFFSYDDFRKMSVVDVGCGNGEFVKFGANIFKRSCGYDVAGDSITEHELLTTAWDLAVFSDVIEHMPDIEYMFKIPWEWAFISFPETPKVENQDQLHGWRHFKPNEHIWCLNADGMRQFANDNKCIVMRQTNVEDLIRTRWDTKRPNITSMLIRR